jgi:hypothetical protein
VDGCARDDLGDLGYQAVLVCSLFPYNWMGAVLVCPWLP